MTARILTDVSCSPHVSVEGLPATPTTPVTTCLIYGRDTAQKRSDATILPWTAIQDRTRWRLTRTLITRPICLIACAGPAPSHTSSP